MNGECGGPPPNGAPHKSGEKNTALNSPLWIRGTFLLGRRGSREGREGDKLVAVTKEVEGGINQSEGGSKKYE